MSYTYNIGDTMSYVLGAGDHDYNKMCEAPKGTLLYTPSGKIVERGARGIETYYGNPDQPHYYESDGVYVIVGLPENKVGELAKELWGVRNKALAGTYMVSDDFVTPDHEKTYRALAEFVLRREGNL